ncbi:unnamed protein product [Didymodactylos carnosus]|uniref:Uncharacterized protein n=1 Tax=Didymodactylos carnosus TaxID=1234261 RepID=A0A815UFI8_9BILA|nr:unnamed protein product [Didymodactylos carnosus]CAF4375439.1 unnamed protein product [Didymodactylos carnosus]
MAKGLSVNFTVTQLYNRLPNQDYCGTSYSTHYTSTLSTYYGATVIGLVGEGKALGRTLKNNLVLGQCSDRVGPSPTGLPRSYAYA